MSKKCICLKPFKPEIGISNSQKMQGKEKVPPVDLVSLDDHNMDSSSANSKGNYRKKIKKKCNRVFKAVLSKKKKGTEHEDDILKSSISVLHDALRPLNPSHDGHKRLPAVDAESNGSVSSRYSRFSSSLPGSSTSYSGQPSSSSSSNCSSIANSRSGSQRKQSCNSSVVDFKAQPPPLIKKDFPAKKGSSGRNHALYFVLVCLVGVIFGGKALAIFCTSTCLFLLPCCIRRFASRVDDVDPGRMRQGYKSFNEK